jgi:hypothetical protein
MTRLETVAQYQCSAQPAEPDLKGGFAPVVVAFDDRNLDAEQAPLAGLAVEQTHKQSAVSGQRSAVSNQPMQS